MEKQERLPDYTCLTEWQGRYFKYEQNYERNCNFVRYFYFIEFGFDKAYERSFSLEAMSIDFDVCTHKTLVEIKHEYASIQLNEIEYFTEIRSAEYADAMKRAISIISNVTNIDTMNEN